MPRSIFRGPRRPRRLPVRPIAAAVLLSAAILSPSRNAAAAETAVRSATAAAFAATKFERQPTAAELTDLGRAMFFDPSLSASGKMSCATCHDPKRAFGPPNEEPVQRGGVDGKRPGLRAVPSLRYTQDVPRFGEHHFDEAVDESVDQGPTGGRTWDGRADTAHDQAQLPLLSEFEMANANPDAVVERIARGALAARFRAVFGEHVLDDRTLAYRGALSALEVFQQSPKEFYPYTSRYDQWLRGKKDALDAAELRGLALFDAEDKGNCASCHPSQIRQGAFPQFTDYGHIALGVPRNPKIPANADPAWHDLGLCGPLRHDLSDHPEYCGLFRAPTLRNAALRRSFFHNGRFHDLEDVVRFYVTRDTDPKRWYAHGKNGKPRPYDDLPTKYRDNLNRDPPFGGKPALSEDEIRDVVAFLKTLTDADLAASP